MPYTVYDILTRCRDTLIDPIKPPATDGRYWFNQFLLSHLNAAIASTVLIDKKASVVNASIEMVAGTKQTLPPDAVALISYVRNMGSDGTKAGRAITTVRMDQMDAARPDWHSDPPSAVTRHAMADPEDPRRSYIWPPSPGGSFNEIRYEQVPDDVTIEYTGAVEASAGGQVVLGMTNTFGITMGQTVYNLTTPESIGTGVTVASIVPNTSVNLSADLLGDVGAGDVLAFSDKYPLPDLYAEPAFLFVVAHALMKNTTKQDITRSQFFWGLFQSELGIDQQTIDRLGIGKPST